METVLVSQKFQVVIPRAIRQALGIEPGQRLQAFHYGDRVELVPLRPLAQARGFLAGLDSHIDREADRV
jgi:AbrB family looped-hinge helix DNA binding protein